MHALVVGDGNPFHRYREFGGQCRAIAVPAGEATMTSTSESRAKPPEAALGDLAPAAANCSSIDADPLNRSTLRASSSPTVARKFSPSSGMFTQCTRPSPNRPRSTRTTVPPDWGERKVLAHPAPGSASLVTTSPRLMVCERRKPSTICSAVRIPHVPLAMSNENVP